MLILASVDPLDQFNKIFMITGC